MIEFPFEQVNTPRGILHRPRATVRLIGPSESLNVDCLVDSGADTTVLTWEVGQDQKLNNFTDRAVPGKSL